jgi:hypothetical protein
MKKLITVLALSLTATVCFARGPNYGFRCKTTSDQALAELNFSTEVGISLSNFSNSLSGVYPYFDLRLNVITGRAYEMKFDFQTVDMQVTQYIEDKIDPNYFWVAFELGQLTRRGLENYEFTPSDEIPTQWIEINTAHPFDDSTLYVMDKKNNRHAAEVVKINCTSAAYEQALNEIEKVSLELYRLHSPSRTEEFDAARVEKFTKKLEKLKKTANALR